MVFHYSKAGSGDPIFPAAWRSKTSYHWRYVIPLLTPYYTVIVPLRGLGDSHPASGFDMRNVAEDIAHLPLLLGSSRLVGEDWGAVAAYQLGSLSERVQQLVYQESILPGFGFEEHSFLTAENVRTGVWLWYQLLQCP